MTMTAAIDPTSSALNYVVVAGIPSPGRAKLTGLRIPYKWNVQEAYGRSGARSTFIGRGIIKFTLTIALWLPEHFIQWIPFAKVLEPPTTLKPFTVKMIHPLLSAAGIDSVGLEGLGVPERQDNGMWISTSQVIESRPLKPALVTPRGAIPGVPTKLKPPLTETQRILLEERAKFEAAEKAAR